MGRVDLHDDLPTSLHRIPNSLDCPSLVLQCALANSKRRRIQQTSCCSENSQVLYMAPTPRSHRKDHSSTTIENHFSRELDGSADGEPNTDRNMSSAEQLSGDIINREIFEWQYVCQTNRPFWWSPQTKFARLKTIQPKLNNDPSPHIWMQNIDLRAKPAYAERRQAASDSYLEDPSTVHDLAHLVAIQLLGASFTLPPDHILDIPTSSCTNFTEEGLTEIPGPRMISSLRLHTHFRYSPSFGHQARNTSPTYLWPGTVDGSSNSGVTSPRDESLDQSTQLQRESRPQLRKVNSTSPGCGKREHGRSLTDFETPTAAINRSRRHDLQDINSHVLKIPRFASAQNRLKRKMRTSKSELDCQDGILTPDLQSSHQISSTDDHPRAAMYNQFRKLSAARRWAKLRKRFGGTVHITAPESKPEDVLPQFGVNVSSLSGELAKNTNAKKRKVRQRDDTESSSMHERPRYHSPMSGNLSPVESKISGLQSFPPAPTLPEAEAFNAAATPMPSASRVTKYADQHRELSIQSSSVMSILEPILKPPVLPIDTSFAEFDSVPAISNSSDGRYPNGSPTSMGPGIPTPGRRASTWGRSRRRSMLSDVWTADDFTDAPRHRCRCCGGSDRNSASVAESALDNPKAKVEQCLMMPKAAELESGHDGTMSRESVSEDEIERPWFHRTSWGTQIFTPDADGIEVDGLPVGPHQETWSSGERTYL